ncbi:hypothetical protein IQ07DRAFT_593882 [Pyrenochaeta sp. DS3sAY3a]|nr:hypothetical protein IQ07DRAFT_593882 [Pyrenochaeta sp. DS3sAY3a]
MGQLQKPMAQLANTPADELPVILENTSGVLGLALSTVDPEIPTEKEVKISTAMVSSAAGEHYKSVPDDDIRSHHVSNMHPRMGQANILKEGYMQAIALQLRHKLGFRSDIDIRQGIQKMGSVDRMQLIAKLNRELDDMRAFANYEAELHADIKATLKAEIDEQVQARRGKNLDELSVPALGKLRAEVAKREIEEYLGIFTQANNSSEATIFEMASYLTLLHEIKEQDYWALLVFRRDILNNTWVKSGTEEILPFIRAWNNVYGPFMNFVEDYPLHSGEASQISYCVGFVLDGQRI